MRYRKDRDFVKTTIRRNKPDSPWPFTLSPPVFLIAAVNEESVITEYVRPGDYFWGFNGQHGRRLPKYGFADGGFSVLRRVGFKYEMVRINCRLPDHERWKNAMDIISKDVLLVIESATPNISAGCQVVSVEGATIFRDISNELNSDKVEIIVKFMHPDGPQADIALPMYYEEPFERVRVVKLSYAPYGIKMNPKTWKIESIVPRSCMDTWNADNGSEQGFVKAGDRIISVNGATPSIDNIANAPAPLVLHLSPGMKQKAVKHEEDGHEDKEMSFDSDDEDGNDILPFEVAIGKHKGNQPARRGFFTDSVTEAIARRYYPMTIRLTRAVGEDWGVMCDGTSNQVMPTSISPRTAAARWNNSNPKRAIIPGLTYFASINNHASPERMRWELLRADINVVVLDLGWRGGNCSFKKRYMDDEGGTKKIPRAVVISGTGVITCTPLNAVVGASVMRGVHWSKSDQDCVEPVPLRKKTKKPLNAPTKSGRSSEDFRSMIIKEVRQNAPFYGAISHVHDWGWRVDAADSTGSATKRKAGDILHAGCMIRRINGSDVHHITSEADIWHLLSHPCTIEFYDAIHERHWVNNYASVRELEEDHAPFLLAECFSFVKVAEGWYISDKKKTISGGSLLGRGCVITRVGPYLLRQYEVGNEPWAQQGKNSHRVCFYNEERGASGTIVSLDLTTKCCCVKWKASGEVGWYRIGMEDRYELALCEIAGEYVIGRSHRGGMVYYKSEAGHTLCLQRHGFNWTISHEITTFARARAVYSDVPPPSNWEIWCGKWGPSNLTVSAKLEYDPVDEMTLAPLSLSQRWPDNVQCGALTLKADVHDIAFRKEGSVVERCNPFFQAIQSAFARVLKISADDIGIVNVLELADKEGMKVAIHIRRNPGRPASDSFDQLRKLWSPGSPLFTLTASPLRRFVSAFDFAAGIQPCSAGCGAPGEPKVESYVEGGVKLRWQSPASGRPVKHYQVLMQVNNGQFRVRIPVAFGTTATVYPLAMDDTYRFRVRGVTDVGAGLESETSIAIFPQRWVLKSDRIMQLAAIEQRLKKRRNTSGHKSTRAPYDWEDHTALSRDNIKYRARDADERYAVEREELIQEQELEISQLRQALEKAQLETNLSRQVVEASALYEGDNFVTKWVNRGVCSRSSRLN